MISNLKPYAKYKDPGVPRLGKVPEHWEVRRLKYLLQERDSRSTDGSEPLLSVSQYTGVTRRGGETGDNLSTRAASLVGYKRVIENDLVVNIMLAWNGSMGVSNFTGIVSPSYCVYRFNSGAFPGFFHYLLRSPSYKTRIKALSTGVVESRLRLYTDDLYRLEGLLPSLPEQTAIVRFLDYMDRRIRRAIQEREKRIKLLKEYKQALIHQAVTGQIDVRTGKPYPKYKYSGVDWLGKVPEHWEVRRLKYLLRERDIRSANGSEQLLRVSQYSGVTERRRSHGADTPDTRALSLVGYKCVDVNDLVINIMLAWNGSMGVSKYIGIVSPAYCVYYFSTISNPWYFHYLLCSTSYKAQIKAVSKGVIESRLRLYTDNLYRLKVPLPPLYEQTAIVEFLDDQTERIDASIAADRRVIDLLKEFRTRLVADVVTGKVDVREVAKTLPEESHGYDKEPVKDDGVTTDITNEINEKHNLQEVVGT